MVSGGSLRCGGCAKNATCFRKSYLLRAEVASSPKKTLIEMWGRSKDCGMWMILVGNLVFAQMHVGVFMCTCFAL